MSKKETLFGAHLPTDFVEEVRQYVSKTNQKSSDIVKVTLRTVMYNALKEYMVNHKV